MKTLYFDCFAGASGNMILGALIGLGVDSDELIDRIRPLGVPDFEIKFAKVSRSGISATHAEVTVPSEHVHRHLNKIEDTIERASLSDGVKSRSIAIFTRLAEAEAKVHGVAVESVHFHEVGAMDAIIDIVGCCVAFEMLGIERFACSKIHVGSGFVEMSHGRFPVPPPAVVELLQNVPIYSTEISGELITPTGAAIISTLCDSYGELPQLRVEHVAYGAGSREYERFPNVLRLMLGQTESASAVSGQPEIDRLFLLETNVDDVSPQVLGFVMERAFETGALDCWFTPIQMKKNRPATMISILCSREHRQPMADLLYRETTTLGIRFREVERECIQRDNVSVQTTFGEIRMKVARHGDSIVNVMPEYEDVKQAALRHSVAFRNVSKAAVAAFEKSQRSMAANG